MNSNQDKKAERCLHKLEALKKKIQQLMEIRSSANFLNKYRINYEITQPKNLVGGTLQQHQLESLEWMINLASQEANGILADDMGLGKTIQAIAYLAYLREESGIRGKHLVICPKSVSTNWMRQIKKWLPSSRTELLINTEYEREIFINEVLRPLRFDIIVTTYQGAKTCLRRLEKVKWEVIVVDQAHKMKNFDSQNFKAIKCYKATFKLLLSGTPLSNNLKELWTLLYLIMPQIFHDATLFDEIEQATQEFKGTQEQKLNFRMKIAKYFHTIINPFFKRRSKKDLELGLPPKIQKTLYVPLSKMQLQMYKNFLRYGSVYGEGHHINRNVMNARKICLHPYLFDDMWPEDEEEFGQHAIQNCGKLKVLDKLLQKLLEQGHKVLIFSQFTLFLDVLQEYCEYRGFRYCRLDGFTVMQERDQLTQNFNNTDMYQIFLLSTKAGGLGINLTGADRVIIYDIDWNPQNDIQAMDRAYRMGQTKAVHVYKMITEFTIEERIAQFQRYKLIWDQLLIQKGAFMTKKRRDDPFLNVSVQSLINIGKGQIFRLNVDQAEKTIEQIEQLGEQKNKKLEEEIRKKLSDNIQDYDLKKFNPFQQDTQDFIPESKDEQVVLVRRNYETQVRQKAKFDRNGIIPPFRFYVKLQKIKELEFEVYMELKRDQNERNDNILNHLRAQLDKIYQNQKFHSWNQKQFDSFVDAHQLYLQNDYKNIAQFIQTKNEEEVQNYSKMFFMKAPNNERLERQLQRIMIGQKLVKLRMNQYQDHLKTQHQPKNYPNINNQSAKVLSTQLLLKEIGRLQEMKKKSIKLNTQKQEKQKQKELEKQQKRRQKEQQLLLKQEQKKAREQQKDRLKQLKQQAKKQKDENWQKMLELRKEKQQQKAQKEQDNRARLKGSQELRRKEKQQAKLERSNSILLKTTLSELQQSTQIEKSMSQSKSNETANKYLQQKSDQNSDYFNHNLGKKTNQDKARPLNQYRKPN